MIITPFLISQTVLELVGLGEDGVTETGQLSAEQYSALKAIPFLGDTLIAEINASLKKLNADDRFEVGSTAWLAEFERRVPMIVSSAIMETVEDEAGGTKLVKWIPSFADEIDPIHALNYGKTMRLETAKKKGLGTRPNCKCGFEFVSSVNERNINNKLTINNKKLIEVSQ